MTKRAKALRRAGRTFWRYVIARSPKADLSRRTGLRLAWHGAICGLLTGGDHLWGRLHYRYPGARWRERDCLFCGASMKPASEIERNPLTEDEQRGLQRFMPTAQPTKAEVAAAVKHAEESGLLRNGKWLWD